MLNISVISNIVLEPYLTKCLSEAFSQNTNIEIAVSYVSFNDIISLNVLPEHSDIIVVMVNFHECYPTANIDLYLNKVTKDDLFSDFVYKINCLYNNVKEYKSQLIWFGVEDYYLNLDNIYGSIYNQTLCLDELNIAISKIITKENSYIDLKRLIAKVGCNEAFDNKTKYRWNAPYSKELICVISTEIHKQYKILHGITPKCIVVDCDNVLWGGTISEDGIENIRLGSGLGQEYLDFQKFIVSLYLHGVILAICSKNDEGDVKRVFREHSGMVIKEDYITCFKINWACKARNIVDIAEELNIDFCHMVYVDDSSFEIESVKQKIPDIKTILYDRNSIFQNLSCFSLKQNIDIQNINIRNETYRSNTERKKLIQLCGSQEDYIKQINMVVDIHKTLPTEINRISELSQRTNKCTNGKRYTNSELVSAIENGYDFYSVYVSDKFSNLGLVGAMGIKENSLVLFTLSCRALGRNVERIMIDKLIELSIRKYEFSSTKKNDYLLDLLSKNLHIQ